MSEIQPGLIYCASWTESKNLFRAPENRIQQFQRDSPSLELDLSVG